ncbi:MAG: extracellular solute-binding protein [Acidipropionibacterium sp.]|nr:extracellular solute-binding protein [Acidipropionibacterium sp.]
MSRKLISRRSFFGLSAAASAAMLAACSTSTTAPTQSSATKNLRLWTWPDGFGKPVLSAVKSEFPNVTLTQTIQGGDFKQKLQTTLQAGTGLPDITGIKGEDIAYFKSVPEYFVDLNTLGASSHKSDYFDWKWQQGTTTDGKQIGVPIDIGPTALYYRSDIFEQCGLPSDPEEVAAAVRTWDEYFSLGIKMKKANPKLYLVRNLASIFEISWRQSGKGFINDHAVFIGDQEHIKKAWDLCIQAQKDGINAGFDSNTTDSTAAVANGTLPADFGASWHLADLMVDAPKTSGKWRVCGHPERSTNLGGSFLGIPAKASDKDTSFKILLYILNASNEASEYVHSGNFPANREATHSSQVTGAVPFLGNQKAGILFAKLAETVRPLFEDPNENTVNAPFYSQLQLVESSGKDPKKAWDDAVSQAKRLAKQNGISVD